MPIERIRFAVAGVLAVLLSHASASRAVAAALDCQRAIAQAGSKYVQGRAKILYKCEDAKARLKLRDTIVCATDPLFDPQRLAVTTRLFATINLGCGGANQDCGDGDDQPLGPVGWAIGQCPDVNNTGCTNTIATCADVATCLECTGDAAVDRALDLSYGAFDSGQFGTNSAINRCQRAIGKSVTKYLGSRAKALAKCWDARLLGRHSNPCPTPGDGKAALRIAKAEAKKQKNICKACGGVDGTCDGSGDLSPSSVGFASSCPNVDALNPPSSCGGAIVDAAGVVDCVDCVTDHDVDCASLAAVPGVAGSLPAACNPGTTTTSSTAAPTTSSSSTVAPTTSSTSTITLGSTTSTSTTLPTTTSTTLVATTTSTTSITGSSTTTSTVGSTTTSGAPSTSSTSTPATTTTSTTSGDSSGFDFLSTSSSGSCGNTFRDAGATVPLKNLLCGSLSLGGGLSQVPDNATPAGATNRFALSGCVGTACNIGAVVSGSTPAGVDCTDTGCRFGVPLPISNAGLSVCVTNTFSSPPSGTLDTASGAATWSFQLNSATVLTGNPTQPCPICAVSVGGAACSGSAASPCTGVCDGSPNQGSSCQSKNAQGLSSDCPAPAASVGVQKCYRGTNNGATCSTGGDCPGGLCAQFIGNIAISLNPLTTGTSSLTSQNVASCTGAGAPFTCCTGSGTGNCTGVFCPTQAVTAKGAFNSAVCLNGANSGKPCVNNTTVAANDIANCGAANPSCRPGNLVNYCSGGANDGLGCSSSATCPSPGTCVRAGTLAQLIREVGVPTGALAVGVPKTIKLGSAFCVAATTNPTVNSNANLPGAGATSVVGTITLLP